MLWACVIRVGGLIWSRLKWLVVSPICVIFSPFVGLWRFTRPFYDLPEHQALVTWLNDNGPEYDDSVGRALLEYTQVAAQQSQATIESLEKRASSLLQLTGGVGVASALASRWDGGADFSWWVVLAVLFVVLCAVWCVVVLVPRFSYAPPDPRVYYDDLKTLGSDTMKQWKAPREVYVVLALRITQGRKAVALTWANVSFVLSLASFLCSLVSGWLYLLFAGLVEAVLDTFGPVDWLFRGVGF